MTLTELIAQAKAALATDLHLEGGPDQLPRHRLSGDECVERADRPFRALEPRADLRVCHRVSRGELDDGQGPQEVLDQMRRLRR
jgi:hypothetical protein